LVPLITTVPVVSPRESRIVALVTGPLIGIVWLTVLQLESAHPFEIGGREGKGDCVVEGRRTGAGVEVEEKVEIGEGVGADDLEDEGEKGEVAEGLVEEVGVGRTGTTVCEGVIVGDGVTAELGVGVPVCEGVGKGVPVPVGEPVIEGV